MPIMASRGSRLGSWIKSVGKFAGHVLTAAAEEIDRQADAEREAKASESDGSNEAARTLSGDDLAAVGARGAVDDGPLEQLLDRVLSRELPVPEARRLAAAREVVSDLTLAYVDAVTQHAERAAHEGAGLYRALLLQDLVVTSTAAAKGAVGANPDATEMASRAVLGYLEVARGYLISVPDGRVRRRAVALAERLEEQLRLADDRRALSALLHRLGTLHLDPYTTGRSTEAFWEGHRRWMDELGVALGDSAASIDPQELEMPEPVEAFRQAEKLLEQAAELRTGGARGRSRKAQAEAMLWRRVVGDPVDEQTIAAALRAALADLAWDEDPQTRLTVLQNLRVLGQPVDLNEVERIFERSLDEWRLRLGAATIDLVAQSYLLLRDERPRQALGLLRDARPLAEERGEEAYIGHLRAEITLLATELAGIEEPSLGPGELDSADQELRHRAREERWDVERLFGALLGLVVATGANNEEDAGLRLLAEARASVAPLLAGRHEPALDFLAASYELATGVNGVNYADDANWSEGAHRAVEGYAGALRSFLALRMRNSALDCLARITDVIEHGQGGVALAVSLFRGIAPVALFAEKLIGPQAAKLIRRMAERVLGDSSDSPDNLHNVSQLAKGLRFSTTLYGGSRYQWAEDPVGNRLLSAIATAAAELADEGEEWAPLDENVLLAPYTDDDGAGGEERSADDSQERLAYLRRRYDEHLWDELLAGAAAEEALWLSVADVQAALDDRTALLSYFLDTRTADGQAGVSLLVITRQETRGNLLLHGPPLNGGLIIDGKKMPAPLGSGVAATREGVQRSPGARNISREGEQALTLDYSAYLADGVVLDWLRQQGIDHLCVVPHGPLHYHPLHLVGPPGRPLADNWIVSYFPNLHLFVSRRGRPAARRHRPRAVTAIGLGFKPGNPHGLPPLEGAVSEAEAVAGAFGGTVLPEEDATEAGVIEAFRESRLVHLATHGRHDADAPAFQCLYLTPDESSDGRLHAYELLSLDLRGLDLVTLSACETALGRFDVSDNLRGLPAACILSGVSSLIGTLWQVEDRASKRFFTELYARLHEGDGCLDAFRAAQNTTRAACPAYRDWGAFYLAGDWEW